MLSKLEFDSINWTNEIKVRIASYPDRLCDVRILNKEERSIQAQVPMHKKGNEWTTLEYLLEHVYIDDIIEIVICDK